MLTEDQGELARSERKGLFVNTLTTSDKANRTLGLRRMRWPEMVYLRRCSGSMGPYSPGFHRYFIASGPFPANQSYFMGEIEHWLKEYS